MTVLIVKILKVNNIWLVISSLQKKSTKNLWLLNLFITFLLTYELRFDNIETMVNTNNIKEKVMSKEFENLKGYVTERELGRFGKVETVTVGAIVMLTESTGEFYFIPYAGRNHHQEKVYDSTFKNKLRKQETLHKPFLVSFDDKGGITLSLNNGEFVHYYSKPVFAAEDLAVYLMDQEGRIDLRDWEENEPELLKDIEHETNRNYTTLESLLAITPEHAGFSETVFAEQLKDSLKDTGVII
jgi:hypothetical protein